jgi:hypothetical protein
MRLSPLAAVFIASIVAISAPAPAASQSSAFEGVITSNFYGKPGKPPLEMKSSIKGTHSRQDMNAGGMPIYTITDLQSAKMTSVMPEQQMYITMDLEKAMAKVAPDETEGEAATPPPLTKTGETETIAGRSCDHYLVGEDQDTDVCAATGLGVFRMGSPGGGMGGGPFGGMSLPDGWDQYAAQLQEGFYPLRIEEVDGDKRKLIMEVTKIEPQALSDDLFVVPADYKELKVPGM